MTTDISNVLDAALPTIPQDLFTNDLIVFDVDEEGFQIGDTSMNGINNLNTVFQVKWNPSDHDVAN